MPNTYTQLNIHGVFTVKGRENLLTKNFRYMQHHMFAIVEKSKSYRLRLAVLNRSNRQLKHKNNKKTKIITI